MIEKLFDIASPESAEEFDQYFHFRWQQLRQPLQFPPGSERDEYEAIAFHRMAMNKNNEIIGVGRIHLETPSRAKVRYMATAPDMRHKGVGSAILRDLLAHATDIGANICGLNARESVCAFYQSQGFEIIGGATSELPIPHVLMEKRISDNSS